MNEYGKFFLTRIEGLRTEDVLKAQWGTVIVILAFIS